MFFLFPLEQVTEVIISGEILSNNQFDKLGTVAKNYSFFEFSGSYKNFVTFLGFFIVIVSVLSIFFLQT